jgi:hypothetical protein
VTTKLEKLLAVYARFADAIREIPDAKTQDLHRAFSEVPQFVARARQQATNSQIAAGLEQGLRELQDLSGSIDAQWRWAVSRALHDALTREYPEFLVVDAERLQKIQQRGCIRTEAEFYLVRHRIDVLEGEPELADQLARLYALVGAYESGA